MRTAVLDNPRWLCALLSALPVLLAVLAVAAHAALRPAGPPEPSVHPTPAAR